MALTEVYVDPSIAADSGAGTVGDPYGDLEYAIKQTTFDTTNGTRINIKAGTTETLAANIKAAMNDTSVTVAWAPSAAAPAVFQGYTSAAGDGGIGVISGGGSVPIFTVGGSFIVCRDLRLTNVGANVAVDVDEQCLFIDCEIDTNTSGNLMEVGPDTCVFGCYLHDATALALTTPGPGLFLGNVIDARGATAGLDHAANDHLMIYNLVITDGAGIGIDTAATSYVISNSVFSNAGTGSGIKGQTLAQDYLSIINNVVAGFSGAGGVGIDMDGNAASRGALSAHNSVHDCETAITGTNYVEINNETLGSAPFADAVNLDFAPQNVGSLSENSYPTAFNTVFGTNPFAKWRGGVEPTESTPSGNQLALWRGAVQPAAAVASGGGQVKSGPGLAFGMMGKMGAQ